MGDTEPASDARSGSGEENAEDDDPYDVVKNSLLLIDLLKSLMILTKDRTSKEENKLTQYAD